MCDRTVAPRLLNKWRSLHPDRIVNICASCNIVHVRISEVFAVKIVEILELDRLSVSWSGVLMT